MVKVMLMITLGLVVLNLIACSFTVGVDWQGETQVEQKRFNANKK